MNDPSANPEFYFSDVGLKSFSGSGEGVGSAGFKGVFFVAAGFGLAVFSGAADPRRFSKSCFLVMGEGFKNSGQMLK